MSSKPSQLVKGWVEFYKLKFKVSPNVLIPRPETELLVDEILKFTNRLTVLDLGTGAGNIAISIAKNAPYLKLIATDVSKKALIIARQNAKFHNVEDKIKFIKSNLLEKVSDTPDIIVTNLPYIPSARIPYLESSVKDFEPHIALDGGEDGFELYRKLFAQVKEKSWQPKLIIGEIDYTHGELALKEAQKYFPDAEIEVKKDLAHLQRILTVKNFID